MKKRAALVIVVVIVFACLAGAQGGPGMGMGMGRGSQMGEMPCPMGGPGMGRGGHGMGMGMGKWWNNSELVKTLGLSDSQVQQIEKIFQDHRTRLIDLRAALEKQEAALEPLVEAERPDEAQVTAQIDKVAQARAGLEKSNAQMLLAIRRVLTVDQWKQLRSRGGMRRMAFETSGPRRRGTPGSGRWGM